MSYTDPNSNKTQYFMFSSYILTYCTKQCTTFSVYIMQIHITIISECYTYLFIYNVYTNGRMLYNYIILLIICFVIGSVFPDALGWIFDPVYIVCGVRLYSHQLNTKKSLKIPKG